MVSEKTRKKARKKARRHRPRKKPEKKTRRHRPCWARTSGNLGNTSLPLAQD